MRTHAPTFSDVVKSKTALAGINGQKALAKKTGIDEDTISRHMKDGRWKREQLTELHRYLHFSPEDMAIYFEGR